MQLDSEMSPRAARRWKTWHGYQSIANNLGFDGSAMHSTDKSGVVELLFPCCATRQRVAVVNLRRFAVNCRNAHCDRFNMAPTDAIEAQRQAGAPEVPAPNPARSRRTNANGTLSRAAQADHDIGVLQHQVSVQQTRLDAMQSLVGLREEVTATFDALHAYLVKEGIIKQS